MSSTPASPQGAGTLTHSTASTKGLPCCVQGSYTKLSLGTDQLLNPSGLMQLNTALILFVFTDSLCRRGGPPSSNGRGTQEWKRCNVSYVFDP